MTKLVNWLDGQFYPSTQDFWDDKLFREYVLKNLKAEHSLLDLGAGAGIVAEMNFRGRAARVCGLDPDPRVLENAYLDEAQIGLGENIPWGDETFDVVIADNVLEHLANPKVVFTEVGRVLKPGGVFLFKTPNRRHYMPTIARMTPMAFHRFYNRIRGRDSDDTFPTLYRANRPNDIANALPGTKLSPIEFNLIEGRPEYLRLNFLTYLVGIAYERAVNATSMLKNFRILLVGKVGKKV